jgi:hypothetical protein
MLRFLQRLLGWSSHPTDSNPEGDERRREPRTSVTSVLATHPSRLAETTDAKPATPGVGRKYPELSMNRPGEAGGPPQNTDGIEPVRRRGHGNR